MNFNLNNNQPLIRNQQNYYLDRKLITIHTEDRDSNKWPNENEFEITLPEPVANIQSMRLIEGTFPSNYYTFSEQNQNTKFQFQISNNSVKKMISCAIQDGFYTPEQLAQEIEHDVSRQLISTFVSGTVPDFKVFYDVVGQRYYFGVFNTDVHKFSLNFDTKMSYDLSCGYTKEVWEQNTKWGLGYNLGFDKENKDGSKKSKVNFDYLDASHEYDDVCNDIDYWKPKVKIGGILAGHDYYPHDKDSCGVYPAVNEKIKQFDVSEDCWIHQIS